MVMASFSATPNSISSAVLRIPPPPRATFWPNYGQQLGGGRSRRSRGSSVVTRGGAPGASTYIFAFVFPLSLLAVTIFTSIKISDKLDRDFCEELAINASIVEAEDEDEEDVVTPPVDDEPPRPRSRNRPKREAEVSSR